ncbi:MAG TPA: hypothetical protein VGJ87_10170 [Roseiflexaceae bacterium]
MIPSIYTQETAARARMDDRLHEAQHYHLARRARQLGASRPNQVITASRSGWLFWLAAQLSCYRLAAGDSL